MNPEYCPNCDGLGCYVCGDAGAANTVRYCAICGEPEGSYYAKSCCAEDQMIDERGRVSNIRFHCRPGRGPHPILPGHPAGIPEGDREVTRTEREAAVAADLEADRIIAQARKINRALLIFVLLVAAVLVGFNWPKPADAARRPVFKGTVTICYAPSAKSDPYGQYLSSQWNLAAAAKAAGVGKVRVVKERYPLTTCYGDVRVASAPYARAYGQKVPRTAPYGVYKYAERGVIWDSQIVLGDNVGARASAAQRHAWLVAALKTAVPR